MLGDSHVLLTSLTAAVPPVVTLVAMVVRSIRDSKADPKTAPKRRGAEAELVILNHARSGLDDVQKEWFDGMRADLRDARAENDHVRKDRDLIAKDRDRGWDLARAWREVAKDERHTVNNLLQITGGKPIDPLPGLEDIEGKKQ